MTEIFKPVRGFEGRYEIGSEGTLRRVFTPRSGRYKNRPVLSPAKDKDGYLRSPLTTEQGLKRYFRIHRLVAEAFIPNPENKPEVNHEDGNKENNSVSNLEWVTTEENIRHAICTGLKRQKPGEEHHMSKLTAAQVEEIKTKYNTGEQTQRNLSKLFGVSQAQISRIINNLRWDKVKPDD